MSRDESWQGTLGAFSCCCYCVSLFLFSLFLFWGRRSSSFIWVWCVSSFSVAAEKFGLFRLFSLLLTPSVLSCPCIYLRCCCWNVTGVKGNEPTQVPNKNKMQGQNGYIIFPLQRHTHMGVAKWKRTIFLFFLFRFVPSELTLSSSSPGFQMFSRHTFRWPMMMMTDWCSDQ